MQLLHFLVLLYHKLLISLLKIHQLLVLLLYWLQLLGLSVWLLSTSSYEWARVLLRHDWDGLGLRNICDLDNRLSCSFLKHWKCARSTDLLLRAVLLALRWDKTSSKNSASSLIHRVYLCLCIVRWSFARVLGFLCGSWSLRTLSCGDCFWVRLVSTSNLSGRLKSIWSSTLNGWQLSWDTFIWRFKALWKFLKSFLMKILCWSLVHGSSLTILRWLVLFRLYFLLRLPYGIKLIKHILDLLNLGSICCIDMSIACSNSTCLELSVLLWDKHTMLQSISITWVRTSSLSFLQVFGICLRIRNWSKCALLHLLFLNFFSILL